MSNNLLVVTKVRYIILFKLPCCEGTAMARFDCVLKCLDILTKMQCNFEDVINCSETFCLR